MQGRVLYEAILYHTHQAVLIECDVKERDKLITHLKKYALRVQVLLCNSTDCNFLIKGFPWLFLQVIVSALKDARVYCTAPGYNGSLPKHDLAVLDPRTK